MESVLIKSQIRISYLFESILSGVSEYNASIVRAIFYKLDYENMKKNNILFSEELMSYVFNPDRISRLSKLYNVEFVDIINSLQ